MEEATGSAVAGMIREIEDMKQIDSPYLLSEVELARQLVISFQQLEEVVRNVRKIWKMEFRFADRTISAKNISELPKTTTAVELRNCKFESGSWFGENKKWISERFAALSALTLFSAEDSEAGDELCDGLQKARNLRQLRIGTFLLTQFAVASPIEASLG